MSTAWNRYEWYARPAGGFSITSEGGIANIKAMTAVFKHYGFTEEACAAICGNSVAESNLNPWRWENDNAALDGVKRGYGLFQYTPGYYSSSWTNGYVNNPKLINNAPYSTYYAPNTSTSEVNGNTYDGICQCLAFINDALGKWDKNAWVFSSNPDVWNTTTYAYQFSVRNAAISNFGSGGYITLKQFSKITDIEQATMVFLGAFEKPGTPGGLSARVSNANACLPYVQQVDVREKLPIWLLFKLKEANNIDHLL